MLSFPKAIFFFGQFGTRVGLGRRTRFSNYTYIGIVVNLFLPSEFSASNLQPASNAYAPFLAGIDILPKSLMTTAVVSESYSFETAQHSLLVEFLWLMCGTFKVQYTPASSPVSLL